MLCSTLHSMQHATWFRLQLRESAEMQPRHATALTPCDTAERTNHDAVTVAVPLVAVDRRFELSEAVAVLPLACMHDMNLWPPAPHCASPTQNARQVCTAHRQVRHSQSGSATVCSQCHRDIKAFAFAAAPAVDTPSQRVTVARVPIHPLFSVRAVYLRVHACALHLVSHKCCMRACTLLASSIVAAAPSERPYRMSRCLGTRSTLPQRTARPDAARCVLSHMYKRPAVCWMNFCKTAYSAAMRLGEHLRRVLVCSHHVGIHGLLRWHAGAKAIASVVVCHNIHLVTASR